MELAGLFIVLGAALAVYAGGLRGFFVQDDFGWLETSRFRSLKEYLPCFFQFNPALTYRPLTQETFFWLGQKVFGMWPAGFHGASLIAHLLGATLVYALLRNFFSPLPCLTGTFFYAVHSAHFTSVYWISAFPEPMALVFYLAALILFIRFDRGGDRRCYVFSLAAMVLGILSKESILSLPLVLAAYCLLISRRKLVWTLPYFSISLLYVSMRATSPLVRASPYPLTFGWEAWNNLMAYLSWAAGFSETLLKIKFQWNLERSYPAGGGGVRRGACGAGRVCARQTNCAVLRDMVCGGVAARTLFLPAHLSLLPGSVTGGYFAADCVSASAARKVSRQAWVGLVVRNRCVHPVGFTQQHQA